MLVDCPLTVGQQLTHSRPAVDLGAVAHFCQSTSFAYGLIFNI